MGEGSALPEAAGSSAGDPALVEPDGEGCPAIGPVIDAGAVDAAPVDAGEAGDAGDADVRSTGLVSNITMTAIVTTIGTTSQIA